MTGQIGYGSSVRIGRLGSGSTPEFSTIDLVGDIEAPDEQVEEQETTHMQSPGRRKQFIPGLIDSGELTIPHNYIPGSATHTMLTEIKVSGEEVVIEMTIGATATPESFTGFLKGYRRSAPVNGKMTAEAVFRLSSKLEG